jgi:putative aldouronate transport system permease protein
LRIKKNGFLHEIIKNKTIYLMFVPVALWFLVFRYLPLAGIVVAFKEFNYRDGLFMSPWNGFKNFEYFFKSGKAFLVTKNTLLYNAGFLGCYTIFSVMLAVMVAEINSRVFKKISQTSLFLPYFVSWVVVSAFVYNLFNFEYGMVNNVVEALGFNRINLNKTVEYWYFLLPFLYVWKWIGFGSILYLSAIMGIDQSCYESAMIDGANAFQRIYYITLPSLKPTMTILILLGLGRIMRGEFDMFYQLIGNNGLLINQTDIIDTLVFRSLMGTQDFGMASAGAFYQSVLCFIIIMIFNGLVRKYNPDSALF